MFAILATAFAFLIGSIPFGYLIGRFAYQRDIRKEGSGNIGAMNALRTLGTRGAVAVLLLDVLKGYAAALLPAAIAVLLFHTATNLFQASDPLAALFGAAAVLGHCFSPWLRFKGGKGVATSFGVILALSAPALLVCLVVWVLGALVLTKYSSVGSMASNLFSPVALWWFTRPNPDMPAFVLYGVFAGLLIVWTHRENLARLANGTENRIRLKRSG